MREVLLLVARQRVDRDAGRRELEPRNLIVDCQRNGKAVLRQRSGALDDVARRERLQGEAHVHDLGGVAVRARDVDDVAAAEQVQPAPVFKAKTLDVALPVLSSILPSNHLQIERGVQAVVEKGSRAVGILGISFKAGTDDLRESPMVELTERLIGKGFDVRVYDRNVSLAALHGANREYILNKIPHLARLMVPTLDEVLAHARTLVIGNGAPEFADVPRRIGEGQTVIDFVRVSDSRSVAGVYEGLCW